MNWIKRNLFWIILGLVISIVPIWIIASIIHYNLEPRHKIYVEWTVYDGATERRWNGTYTIAGESYWIENTWKRTGKYGGAYRAVSIVDKNTWGARFNEQIVCIYTGLHDVKVNKIEIIE